MSIPYSRSFRHVSTKHPWNHKAHPLHCSSAMKRFSCLESGLRSRHTSPSPFPNAISQRHFPTPFPQGHSPAPFPTPSLNMSTPPKSSMSGVWATLNAMKARRQASEDATSVAKPRSLDASRKAAFAAFESAVRDEASPADLQRRLQKDDAVRAVVEAHKLRVGKHGAAREIKAVSKAVADAAGDLAVVAERLCNANETAHRIDKVGAR